jgi:hypothetical protein
MFISNYNIEKKSRPQAHLKESVVRTGKYIQSVVQVLYPSVQIRDGGVQPKDSEGGRSCVTVSSQSSTTQLCEDAPIIMDQLKSASAVFFQRRRDGKDRSKRRDCIGKHKSYEPEHSAEPEPDALGQWRVVRQAVPDLDHLVHDDVVHVLDACLSEDET